MKVHITNLYGQSQASVAQIAQNLSASVAKGLGFYEIGIYSYPVDTDSDSELSKRIDGMIAAVGWGDVVIFQSPSWNSTEFDDFFVNKVKAYPDLKVVIFVHDIIPLMFKSNEYLIDKTIATYNKADAIILPSRKMEAELRRWGLTTEKVIIQHMWDHPTQNLYSRPQFKKEVIFAGNPSRFTFVNEWRYDLPLRLYSSETAEGENLNIIPEGWRNDAELIQEMPQKGGFGLVWSQISDVDYYEWNISYKLSSYLAAGMPVIVQDTLSNAKIIQDNHLGIVVKNLEEAQARIADMTPEAYDHMVESVRKFRELVIDGYFTKKVLIDSVHAVMTEHPYD